jgi:uncharacterized protein
MEGIMQKRNKITIILITSILLLCISYFAIGNYFYNFALNANAEKDFLADNPNLKPSNAINREREAKEREKDIQFIETVKNTQHTIISSDELKLQLEGTIYEQENATKWVVIVHGYTSKSSDMRRWIRHFYEQGYNVLAPDLRGHGESEGDYIGMGWHDRLDLLRWLSYLNDVHNNPDTVLFGISMGAATVLMASGEEMPNNVKAIIADCGYSTVYDVFKYQLKDLFGLPPFPVMNAANTVTKWRANYDLHEASAVKQVKFNTVPILYIHGDADTFVPYEMLDELYDATTSEKEKLIIEQAGHGEAVRVNPDLYWSTIWSFLAKKM